jgi:hypothetical protein
MGTLSGKVLDSEDVPVVGARVWVNTFDGDALQEKTQAEAWTEADGRFRLGPIDPVYRHRFDVLVDADGFARCYVPGGTYSIFPGRDEDLGTIRLDRGCVFTGRVLDVDGAPQPDATVECQVHRFTLGHTVVPLGPAQTLTTDAEGRFRTQPLPVGRLYLLVRVPDRQMAGVFRPIPPGGEEELGPIRLERDVPIPGAVRDEQGRPVAGAKISAYVSETTSDEAGQFTLHGFGPNPRFQLKIRKDGLVFVDLSVVVAGDGIRWFEVGGDMKSFGPVKDLTVVMRPKAWIDGQALDADTGEPVRLDKVVLCFFQRKPDGEVVLNGCRLPDFEQPEAGRFRVAYSYPDEYHLTLSASGYHDAEAFTPKVTELKPIAGITDKMKKQTERSKPEMTRQRISGTVTRDGRPVEVGWVGLWAPVRARHNAPNACVVRGRTVERGPAVFASAPIQDGAYVLDIPFQDNDWYVAVEEPGQPLTQLGPIAVSLHQATTLDIACVKGGVIGGRVKGIPTGLEGHLWVVAFSKTAIRAEARVGRDGGFALPPLPPGEYGLKVGHDAYEDPDVPRGLDIPEEDWTRPADPWKRAKLVEMESGRDHAGIEVEFPP